MLYAAGKVMYSVSITSYASNYLVTNMASVNSRWQITLNQLILTMQMQTAWQP